MLVDPVRILDLFCGAGGAGMGYHRAGFEVVGVDVVRQPHYPFTFIQADAVAFLASIDPAEWDAVHASPPCKAHTVARKVSASRFPTLFDPHPDLIPPTRVGLIASGLPYVIENVPGAPLVDPVVYCGSSFGLRVRRHRLFESNVELVAPPCDHAAQGSPVGVYGNGGAWTRTAPGGGGVKVAGKDAADALGIDWTDYQPVLSQAIPPAYTEHIGRQLMEATP
jgi:DNA (cytosine-5)-methyltransferase 1